jgi:hypothetical protein
MSDSLIFKHGPDFQRSVIRMMLVDRGFCFKSCAYLRSDYFSGELKWFYTRVKDFFEHYRRSPSEVELKSEVLKHGDRAAQYEAELERILSARAIGLDYLKRELTGFIRANIFVGSYRQAADLYNNGDRDEAYRFTKTRLDELIVADFEKERVMSFGDAERVLELARLQFTEAIPTGIHFIDDAMFGGMMPQTWTTFIGGSNVGKSMLCPNLAYYAYKLKGKKTFVTVHEDEETPTYLRYLACWSNVPYNRLLLPKSDRTEEENRQIKDADELLREYVKMKFMFGTERYVENVVDEVRNMKDQWDLSLFLCDYGQCLKSRVFKSMDDKYSLQEYIYEELKQTCMQTGIAGAGGAQANRLGHKVARKGQDLLRGTDVGDSWGIYKKSSNVITMNRSTDDTQNNRITFLLDKVRNGRCPVAVQCITDYTRCVTHQPYSESHGTQTEIPVVESESM